MNIRAADKRSTMPEIPQGQVYQRSLEAVMVGWESARRIRNSASWIRARLKKISKNRAAGRTHMTTSSRSGESSGASANNTLTRRDLLATAAFGAIAVRGMAFAGAPQGQLTLALHVSLAPTWFDPAETQALITPFMFLYALPDAMVEVMPGELQAACLAESWSASEDSLGYEFVL